MTSPDGFAKHRDVAPGDAALVREDLCDVALEQLWASGAAMAGARGRGAGVQVLDLALADGSLLRAVARDYRRGGALGRVLGARYLSAERAVAELEVLAALSARGVAVVEPLAALARRVGLTHRLRLLTKLVPDALPLPGFCAMQPSMRRAAVREAGAVVARAFAAGLVHRDLHVDNLIVATDRAGGAVSVWMLDLDRAELRSTPLPRAEVDAMLLRMARYLYRHHARVVASRTDQLRFLRGLGLSRAARAELWRRLAPELARVLARHRLAWVLRGGAG